MFTFVFVTTGILVLAFSLMFLTRHRSNGTIALHRHPEDVRRKRSERVVPDEDTQGWLI